MKKIINKILKFFVKIFKILYRILDVLIITPISKSVYWLLDGLNNKNGRLDKFLNNPNTLIYISLFFAFIAFFAIDLKAVNLSETEAIVLSNQPIKAEYNEEKYVVEGIPETADIVLMGKKSSLYLAEQLGDHKLTLDLTNYSEGTHKVNIKYNNPINTLDYKLDPSRVTIVIYKKVSESKTLTTDILNTDKLDPTLVISSVELNKTEVIIKSYKEKLETVASVKALVDVNALNATQTGTYTLDNVKLIAYDEKGTEIKDIEIVPGSVTATVTIKSPSKAVPIKVIPEGNVSSGSAISSIKPNVSTVTLYGDEEVLKGIEYVEVPINVEGLSADKTYQETITKPNGIRSMSETAITIKVQMETETSKDFLGITIDIVGLDTTKFDAKAATVEDTKVDVQVKGVQSLLDKLTSDDIKAYVDLSNIDEETTIEVPVLVTGEDNKLTYISKKTRVKIVIKRKN
ncbi:MAG: CdaR family protein [bacterium]|nr:CdaR family protein [bacterium]